MIHLKKLFSQNIFGLIFIFYIHENIIYLRHDAMNKKIEGIIFS